MSSYTYGCTSPFPSLVGSNPLELCSRKHLQTDRHKCNYPVAWVYELSSPVMLFHLLFGMTGEAIAGPQSIGQSVHPTPDCLALWLALHISPRGWMFLSPVMTQTSRGSGVWETVWVWLIKHTYYPICFIHTGCLLWCLLWCYLNNL